MKDSQPGIFHDLPKQSRYLGFDIQSDASAEQIKSSLKELTDLADGDTMVVGFGLSLLNKLDITITGMRNMPVLSGPGFDVPSTPVALWCWLRGDDRGVLYHMARRLEQCLFPAFNPVYVLDGFMYADSRDLSGYEDGTENPQDEDAVAAAIVSGQGKGVDGSSFVVVQQWLHDMDTLQDKSIEQQDDIIGRHISDNEEFDEAPESAHVKRSAQESFSPEAFILRRSMPWVDGTDAGLNFVAFGKSFDAFEAILNRMLGKEDGIVDALFSFTRPIGGFYLWCPPLKDNKLDLSVIDLS